MEYLYDMGFLINRSMHRVLKNEGYLYDQDARQYTPEELADVMFMAEETYKDVLKFVKGEINTYGLDGNTYTLCFDDKEFQLRPEYKNRPTPEFNRELKRIAQKKLLNLPNTPRFKKVVGYGMEADDWIYTLRLENSRQGKYTCIHANDCDLLCNIDEYTTGIFYKARTSNDIDKESWDAAIGEVFCHEIPYNAIWLYKITVGDTSDNIKGIHKFGPKAFDKLIAEMRQAGTPFHLLSTMKGFKVFLEHQNGLQRFITPEQYAQALEAWKLVRPIALEEAKELAAEREEEQISTAIHM